MELRDIEIFLTLAEELHFGRTAARLHVSTARISTSIKQQERQVGAVLFERTSRTVRLTVVGQQLRDELHPIYHGLKDSLHRARLAARGVTDVVRIGSMATNVSDLGNLWNAFRARHPQWDLHIRYSGFADGFGPLRRDEIDVLISWLPVEEPDLSVGPVIFTDGRVLMVAADHPLAEHDTVSIEVLGDHGVLAGPPLPEYWIDGFTPWYTPRGRPIERHHRLKVATLEDIFTYVSTGQAIHHLGGMASRFHRRPDIAYIPFHDAPPVRWALVWRSSAETEPIRALARIARDQGIMTM